MSKAILEFNLEEPHERNEFRRASKATDAYLALFNMQQHMRAIHKYGSDELSEETYEFLEKLRERFEEIMHEDGVDLDRDLD